MLRILDLKNCKACESKVILDMTTFAAWCEPEKGETLHESVTHSTRQCRGTLFASKESLTYVSYVPSYCRQEGTSVRWRYYHFKKHSLYSSPTAHLIRQSISHELYDCEIPVGTANNKLIIFIYSDWQAMYIQY